jgi:hypothetical protein
MMVCRSLPRNSRSFGAGRTSVTGTRRSYGSAASALSSQLASTSDRMMSGVNIQGGVTSGGTIVDTHSGGRQYFRVPMESVEAVKFAADHVGLADVLRFKQTSPDRFRPSVEEAVG